MQVTLQTVFFILLITPSVFGSSSGSDVPVVCVIGGGISGASTAHFLSTDVDKDVKVIVFEKSTEVGGRIHSSRIPNSPPIEAGASIIAADNSIMQYFVKILNLTKAESKSGSELGLWDGTQFVYKSTPSKWKDILQLLLRYKLSIIRMDRFVSALISEYAKLYPKQIDSGWTAFDTVEDLLERSNLYSLTQQNFTHVISDMFSQRMINEMVSGITRVNYGQEVGDMNGMAGAVGLAGSGGGLWSVEGGNSQVVKLLLEQSGAKVLRDTNIILVERDVSDTISYTLHSETERWSCNGVVFAHPFEGSSAKVPKEFADLMDVERKFQQTVSTFVRGKLSSRKFGADCPGTILTIEGSKEKFTSIGKISGEGEVYKVFSRTELSKDTVDELFEDGEVLGTFPWMAYPKYKSKERFARFHIDEKGCFVYTAPLESAGSAMEMSALSGANAAAVVKRQLGLKTDSEVSGKEEL